MFTESIEKFNQKNKDKLKTRYTKFLQENKND